MKKQVCRSYGEAISEALVWLSARRGAPLEVAYESRMGGYGMRTADGTSGYRIEFDDACQAHINVWCKKEKGPHFLFPGNRSAVRATWRQLFWWDPRLRRRSCGG